MSCVACGTKGAPNIMTPAERRILVLQPFPVVTRHTTSYPHAGTLIDRDADPNSTKQRLRDGDTLRVADPTIDDIDFDIDEVS